MQPSCISPLAEKRKGQMPNRQKGVLIPRYPGGWWGMGGHLLRPLTPSFTEGPMSRLGVQPEVWHSNDCCWGLESVLSPGLSEAAREAGQDQAVHP